jgi:hypothetical protein
MALKVERDAAEFLGVHYRTMQNWRGRGVGPRFIKLPTGAVRYELADLEAFLAGRSFQSTTEARAARKGAVNSSPTP